MVVGGRMCLVVGAGVLLLLLLLRLPMKRKVLGRPEGINRRAGGGSLRTAMVSHAVRFVVD